MSEHDQYLFRALVYAYHRIGIPVVKETLEIFMECEDKQAMVDRAEQWARGIRNCDWMIMLPDRMDAVQQIAREALK